MMLWQLHLVPECGLVQIDQSTLSIQFGSMQIVSIHMRKCVALHSTAHIFSNVMSLCAFTCAVIMHAYKCTIMLCFTQLNIWVPVHSGY